MSRTVPSQIVGFIGKVWDFAVSEPPNPTNPRTIGVDHKAQLAALMDLISMVPDELQPTDPDRFIEFVSASASIRETLKQWQAAGVPRTGVPCMPEFENRSPITLLRNSLATCPDEAPVPGTSSLSFIVDSEFRENIRRDISSANRDLAEGNWKAATVIAGATIEALLLWTLQQKTEVEVLCAVAKLRNDGSRTKNLDQDLSRWYLSDYITVATQLNMISAQTALQCELAKDFRNLIHPGRSVRLGQVCDRGTALAAIAAVERVIADFR